MKNLFELVKTNKDNIIKGALTIGGVVGAGLLIASLNKFDESDETPGLDIYELPFDPETNVLDFDIPKEQ